MEVTFYSNFKKRINSTKVPSGGTSMEVFIKDKCDLHAPVLKIQGEAGQYNYFKINDTFYFVNGETVMPSGWVEISGVPDAMGTCAEDIKATTAFIIRSGLGSTSLVDSLAPSQTDGTPEVISSSVLPNMSSTGTYVVTVSNLASSIILQQGQFAQLYNRLNTQDVVEQVKDNFADVGSLISGAIWLPFTNLPTIGSSPTIKAGMVDLGVSGSFVGNQPLSFTFGMGTGGSASSIDSSAYKSLKLHLPFVGAVPLSPDDFVNGVMNVSCAVDPQSGSIGYRISNGEAHIASYSGTCGVPIPIGTTSYNIVGALASTVGAATGIAAAISTGGAAGALLGAGSIVSGAAGFAGFATQSTTGGGNGNRVGLAFNNVTLSAIRRTPPEALTSKITVAGLPDYHTRSLSSVNGFVQCYNASVESHHEAGLVAQCNNFLNQGAYIE